MRYESNARRSTGADFLPQVYGEVDIGASDLQEQSRLDPTNPYAASKTAAENMVLAYVKSFKLPVVVVRLNNVYGPHQVSDAAYLYKTLELIMRSIPKVSFRECGKNLVPAY